MASKRTTIPVRANPNFWKELQEMKMKRISNGLDKPLNPTKTSRITLAMTRHPLFPQMKKDIIKAKLK